jgi:hypothetical protein
VGAAVAAKVVGEGEVGGIAVDDAVAEAAVGPLDPQPPMETAATSRPPTSVDRWCLMTLPAPDGDSPGTALGVGVGVGRAGLEQSRTVAPTP